MTRHFIKFIIPFFQVLITAGLMVVCFMHLSHEYKKNVERLVAQLQMTIGYCQQNSSCDQSKLERAINLHQWLGSK